MFHDDLWAYLGNNRRDRLYGKSLVKDLMLNDYCPELGRIMEALAEEGFAERISQAARFGKKDLFLIPVEEAREKLAGEGTFRQDLVNYAADSVSYAFEFLDEVQEGRGAEFPGGRAQSWRDVPLRARSPEGSR